MTKQTAEGQLRDDQIWVSFREGTYQSGHNVTLGIGDHVGGLGMRFKSMRLSPGACVTFDGCDAEFLGGQAGRVWQHVGYIDKMLADATNGGLPNRIRISKKEGPVVEFWNDNRYNNARDVVTVAPGSSLSGAKMLGGTAHNWANGVTVERDLTAYFGRSNHGGAGDGSPLEVVGPREMGLPQGISGYLNCVKGVLQGYTLLEEEYDWDRRTEQHKEQVVAIILPAINNGKEEAEISVSASITEGVSIEHHFSAGLTAGVSVEVSAGVKPFGIGADVAITASVEATTEAGTGKSRSSEVSATVSSTVPVPGKSQKDVSLMVEKLHCKVPWHQTFRNDITGFEVHRSSMSTFKRAVRAPAVIGEAVPLG